MYKCKPESNIKSTGLLVFGSFAVTLITLFVAEAVAYSGPVRLLGFAFFVSSLLFIMRYGMTEMEYTVDGTDFSVTKTVGSKKTVVCNINLESAIGVYEKNEYNHLPASEKGIIKYNLCQNFRAESFVLLFDFNGKRAMVEFEPNNTFVGILKTAIENAKKNTDSTENENH